MKVQAMKRLGKAIAALGITALIGCGGFFPANDTTTGTGSGGTSTTGDYVYAVNPTASTLSAYTIGSGTLTAISGSPYALASTVAPLSICVSGLNSFVYIAGTGGIYGYSIGTNGALTQLSSGAVLANVNTARIACSPDGKWLVGIEGTTATQQVDEYAIDTSTGLLTTANSQTYTVQSGVTPTPQTIAFSPLAGYVVAALGAGGDAVFTFNTSTGALTYAYTIFTASTTINHNAVAVNATDTTLYIASSGSTSGVITLGLGATTVTGSNTPVAAGTAPYSLVLSSTGGFLYVGNLGNASANTAGSISQYSFSSGIPSPLSASSIAATGYVSSIARDKSGNYILAGLSGTSTDLTLYSFSTATTGTLVSAATQATSSANDSAGLQIATTH